MLSDIKRLLWVIFFEQTSSSIIFPVLTFVFFAANSHLLPASTSFAVRSSYYGISIALSHISGVVSAPILSGLSDYLGRKRLLLLGACGAFVFGIMAAFSIMFHSVIIFLLGALIGGICTKTNPVALAAIGDISNQKNKLVRMGYLQMAIALGALLGPILGGLLATKYFVANYNYVVPFFVASFVALIAIVLTMLIFTETFVNYKDASRIKLSEVKAIISNPLLINVSLVLICSQLSWSMFYQFMPPLLKHGFAFSTTKIGFFVGIIALWLALTTAFFIKPLAKRFTESQIIRFSASLIVVGLVLALFANWWHQSFVMSHLIWFSAVPIAAGDVIIYSLVTSIYSAMAGKDDQGKMMGVSYILVSAIWSLTGLLGGWLLHWSIEAPLYFALVPAILLSVIGVRQRHFDGRLLEGGAS